MVCCSGTTHLTYVTGQVVYTYKVVYIQDNCKSSLCIMPGLCWTTNLFICAGYGPSVTHNYQVSRGMIVPPTKSCLWRLFVEQVVCVTHVQHLCYNLD